MFGSILATKVVKNVVILCPTVFNMVKARGLIILFIILLAFPFRLPASDLPVIKQTSQVQSGRFPSGLSYYLVHNSSSKGYANFALVQKGVGNRDDARVALDGSFFPSKGVGYTPDGYISWEGPAAVFRFEDVPVFQSVASDSALVYLFKLVRSCRNEQAIIVSGDVNTSNIKDRLYMMSLMLEPRLKVEDQDVQWRPERGLKVLHYPSTCRNLSIIKMTYRAPRTPRKYMNTPQPLVTEMYSQELGHILCKRLEGVFAQNDIPLAFVRFRYFDSSRYSDDEKYTLSLGVDARDISSATSLVSGVLSDLDANGVSQDELQDAKARFLSRIYKDAGTPATNRDNVQACVTNYLYGTNLASKGAIFDFFRGRKISPERDLSLFNAFVAALLERDRNLTLEYATPSDEIDAEALKNTFRSSWKSGSTPAAYNVGSSDTLGLYYPVSKKIKISSEIPEPVSGGKMWSFSNGMKVVFRKSADANIRYAFMIRGGFTEIPGLSEGESAFTGDMLRLCTVSGMSPMRFHNMLESNGITIKCTVGVSDMRIFGTVQASKMNLLMRTLLSIQKNRSPDSWAFDYYKRSEALRQEAFRISSNGVNAVMDSIMCPDYLYPSTKTLSKLTDALPGKMESYFSSQFQKCNDGVMFIEGDLDEAYLQKLLCKTLGGFKTGKVFSVRPKIDYRLRSGWSTYTVDVGGSIGDGVSANIAMSAERPFTMQGWCAFRIAVEALRIRLVRDMASAGQHIEVIPQLQILPSERIAVFINCRPCPSEGLPSDVEPEDPLTALGGLRECLASLSLRPLDTAELKGIKNSLSNEMTSELQDPDYITEVFLRRYSEGKDMVSNWQSYLSKVTLDDVSEVLKNLEKGSKVEYVVK